MHMGTTFLKLENRFIHLSAIKLIKSYEEGSIRIFTDVPNAETPGAFYYYDVDDAEQAQKVLAVFEKMSVSA